MPSRPSGPTSSRVMMTTPFGHSAPTQSEPLPKALGQPNSRSRHHTVRGTGWPIVTGQRRASAIVTGRAGYLADLAGAPVGDPAVDPAIGAEPVTVLAGSPLQPRRTTLMPAARAVAAISLYSMGAPSVVPYCCYTATRRRVPARAGGLSAPRWRRR